MSSDLTLSSASATRDTINARAIYVLLMAGIGFPFIAIAAAVWAYASRDASEDEVLVSHYDNQIRIFWIALVIGIIGTLLAIIIIGLIVLLGLWVWLIIQCREGLFQIECDLPAP